MKAACSHAVILTTAALASLFPWLINEMLGIVYIHYYYNNLLHAAESVLVVIQDGR